MKKLAKIIIGYCSLTAIYAMEELEGLHQNSTTSKQAESTVQPELSSLMLEVKKGNSAALADYGNMLFEGKGVAKDRDEAFRMYSQISESILAKPDFLKARLNLGRIYFEGTKTVAKDYGKALKYLGPIASYNHDKDALYCVAHIYLKTYATYINEAAGGGHTEAQADNGLAKLQGIGCKQNIEEGKIWLEMAKKNGSVDAIFNLALIYEKGEGVQKDISKAVELYEEGASKGCKNALFKLGQIYSDGLEDYKPNRNKAISYLSRAVLLNHPQAKELIPQVLNSERVEKK